MNKYYKEFTIADVDTDDEGFMKVDRILSYMAETSTWHTNALGLGIDEIRKNNYGWMLIKWELQIINYPKARDTVTIVTWTSGFDKFYAFREFEILDSSGILITKASSLWVFLDINKRRPIRIPSDIIQNYSTSQQKSFDDFSNIEIEGNLLYKSDEFKVVEDDLDENNHVNNIRYIEWLFLGLAEKEKEYRITRLAINYKKELLLGDCLFTEVIKSKQEDKLYHRISTSKKINALALSFWEKKKTSF